MSNNTSIGSGGPADANENPAPDSRPSKTMGAESGPGAQAPGAQRSVADTTESGVLAPGVLRDVPARGVPLAPDHFPDGPNVEASPGELAAARGDTRLPDKD
jgi:hypothetical protein